MQISLDSPWFNQKQITIRKGIKFVCVGCVGLGINSAIQIGLRRASLPDFWFIIVGNVPGVIWNFFINAIWTFRKV